MTRVGVDVGGTFTDLVAVSDDGTLQIRKVASTPQDPTIGLFRSLDALGAGKTADIDVLVHGTTVATNALLERRGARVVLVTTAGFEDLLWLRRQERAALYDLGRDHPPPLVARDDVIGVRERMGPNGAIIALDETEVARVAKAVAARGPGAIAICLLFSFRHPQHERRLADALSSALPAIPVAASHDVFPAFREYERASTTAAEAYLRPKVSAYLASMATEARGRGITALRIMTSSGGTLAPERASVQAARLALSGPAGGVVGAQLVGAAVGIRDLLTLDMGGTSADASLVTGGVALTEGAESVAGVPIALPAILIETVSAGGGSIASIDDGGALRVGPRSAGAEPGPACYGRGGVEPTVTDACLALGWLDPQFALADGLRLDADAASRALATLTGVANPAAGIVQIATAIMARALKRISVARGIDPREMALLPFGGAGPLFGCALAAELGMSRIVIPPHPGVLSALGLAAAPDRIDLLASAHRPLEEFDAVAFSAAFAPLLERAMNQLPGADVARFVDCRFAGQGYEVTVPVTRQDAGEVSSAFRAAHQARYGYSDPGGNQIIEIVNLRVVAQRIVAGRSPALASRAGVGAPSAGRRKIVLRDGTKVTADVWPLGELPAGRSVRGPAVLSGPDATALIEPGWSGVVHPSGAVIVERA